MARIRVKLNDGQTGTIDEKDFDEKSMTREYSLPQKFVMNQQLPYYAGMVGGAAAAPVTGGLGSIPAAGLVSGTTYALQQLLKPFVGLEMNEPEQNLTGSAKAFGQGSLARSLDMLFSKAADKVLSPVLRKVKIGSPKTVQESIKTTKNVVGKDIEKVISEKGSQAVDPKALSTLVDDVLEFASKPEVQGSPKTQKMILDVAEDLSKSPTLRSATGVATRYGQDIFGQSGKELMKRGTKGITEKSVKKFAGEGARELTTDIAPELVKMYADYGQLANLGGQMSQPLKNWWMGGLAGTMLSGAGPGVAAPAAAGVSALSMPYSRFLLQKLLSPVVRSVPYGAGMFTGNE